MANRGNTIALLFLGRAFDLLDEYKNITDIHTCKNLKFLWLDNGKDATIDSCEK